MAVTVDATVGGASANSYSEVAEVDVYAERTVWNANWSAKSASEKAQLVVRATEAIDRLRYRGRPATDTQSLQFPRFDTYKPSGALWSTTAIPQPVKNAHMMVAAWLASFAETVDPFKPSADANVKSRKHVDVMGEVEYFGSQPSTGDMFLHERVSAMLRPHGLLGAAGSVRLTR